LITHPEYRLKRWALSPRAGEEVFQSLQAYPRAMAQLLFNRGVATAERAEEYLSSTERINHDPALLADMSKAVQVIVSAIQHDEQIVIYGDYDVDGVTSTALLVEVIEKLGGKVEAYIPDRFEEGYGLNLEALNQLNQRGVRLVVTVDCGIRSMVEADYCREIGLKLVITDHHHPDEHLPKADAVVNPKRADQSYPYPDLAGVGVAYKLTQALLLELTASTEKADRWLDLVALGSVADMAPLTGENRWLVKAGLQVLRTSSRPGIKALFEVAGVRQQRCSAGDIGFMLGPRLNAAGRLESAMAAYHLLHADNEEDAKLLAAKLNAQNSERQEQTRDTQSKAVTYIQQSAAENNLLLVVIDPSFNEGIVGLAASRLVEQYNRPAIVGVMKADEGVTRCSCRSIPGFHITKALDEISDLFEHHGGHAAAAGLTIKNEKLDEFKAKIQKIAQRELGGQDLTPQVNADAEVSLGDLNPELMKYLDLLQPTGYGNPDPVFICRNLRIRNKRAIGADAKHLKLTVTDGWLSAEAICFRFGFLWKELPEKVDLLFTFERNEFNGVVNFQLNVKDIQVS
jgi:single-stranded-DNA-specific exonuclease